jgi:hypothetical protein
LLEVAVAAKLLNRVAAAAGGSTAGWHWRNIGHSELLWLQSGLTALRLSRMWRT